MISRVFSGTLLFIVLLSAFGNSCSSNDTITKRLLNGKLDSLEIVSSSEVEHRNNLIHVGCVSNDDCLPHKLFESLFNELTIREWIRVIKADYRSAIKGYAYIALTYHNYDEREELYYKYHKKVRLMVGHVGSIYTDDEAKKFMNDVNLKSKRWMNTRNANNNVEPVEEEEVKKIENKIRKEQKLAPLK